MNVGGHHQRCQAPWDTCRCEYLWERAESWGDPYALECAYGRFYDPDWEADPHAADEDYGGWSRAFRGAIQ